MIIFIFFLKQWNSLREAHVSIAIRLNTPKPYHCIGHPQLAWNLIRNIAFGYWGDTLRHIYDETFHARIPENVCTLRSGSVWVKCFYIHQIYSTRLVRYFLKDAVTPDSLPRQVYLEGGTAVVVVPGITPFASRASERRMCARTAGFQATI